MSSSKNTLTKQEVELLLKNVIKNENITEANLEITSDSQKGDGYMSDMTKVKIFNSNKTINVIIKSAPISDKKRATVPVNESYVQEIKFYNVIHPKMLKFQTDRNVEPFNSIPKCYITQSNEYQEMLILENLISQEFNMSTQKISMDRAHVLMVLNQFAKFHAISFVMQDQDEMLYEELISNVFNVATKFHPNLLNHFCVYAQKAQDLFVGDVDLCEAMNRLQDDIRGFYMEGGSDVKPKFNVICHGDCWCNNIMFKYQEGSPDPIDMRLIDFQLMRIASPVMDISFFIYANSEKEIYHNLEKYLKIYHEKMAQHMKGLGSDIEKLYPFSELMNDWKKYSRFGYVWALLVRRLSLLEDDEVADIHDVADGKEALVTSVIKNDAILNDMVKDLTLHMYKSGFLE